MLCVSNYFVGHKVEYRSTCLRGNIGEIQGIQDTSHIFLTYTDVWDIFSSMPRIARVCAVKYPHHITQRGNNREAVFFDDEDRKFYPKTLRKYSHKCGFEIWAYSLISVGSLFGIGLITKRANIRTILEILLSWFTTLPIAAIFSGGAYWILGKL